MTKLLKLWSFSLNHSLAQTKLFQTHLTFFLRWTKTPEAFKKKKTFVFHRKDKVIHELTVNDDFRGTIAL